MKKLLIIALIFVSLNAILFASDIKMNKSTAEAIIKESKIQTDNAWKFLNLSDNGYGYGFKATDESTLKFSCRVFVQDGRLYTLFTMEDPRNVLNAMAADDEMSIGMALSFSCGAGKNDLAMYKNNIFFELYPAGAYLLNHGFVNSGNDLKKVELGKSLIASTRIAMTAPNMVDVVHVRNNNVLYAAAYLLVPGLSYEDFLKSAIL